jgi:hypothetical protein
VNVFFLFGRRSLVSRKRFFDWIRGERKRGAEEGVEVEQKSGRERERETDLHNGTGVVDVTGKMLTGLW